MTRKIETIIVHNKASGQINIKQALNKAFRKQKPTKVEIDNLRFELTKMLEEANPKESEEYHKGLIRDFFNNTAYSNYFINTKDRSDLVIHNGQTSKSSAGIIIETKNPNNKTEMPTINNLNKKAIHELLLYFLRERITKQNVEIKHLIVTNLYEWFIFDSHEFEKIVENPKLKKHFKDFEEGRLSFEKTKQFYKEIATPVVEQIKDKIKFVYFNILDYKKLLQNQTKDSDVKLIELQKILSPIHLLKLTLANDSNTLNKEFYNELLYIIGLEEYKEKSKKLIRRKLKESRNEDSLIESAITQITSLYKLSQIKDIERFGNTTEERLYNVALELAITWINRILFLKLLESQIVSYHNNNKDYIFLNKEKVAEYDDLNTLFFQVLAIETKNRSDRIKKKFPNVPYLNSSLFEPTELEQQTILISNLPNDTILPLYNKSVIKSSNDKMNTLEYLFRFLDAYDFSSEGNEDIAEESKTLINASVLGLIFEKINGYKDGSFFTPGFITMYMCRESIRRAVVQKFKEQTDFDSDNFADLVNYTSRAYIKSELEKYNEIINSLKICDPAVGSGHFLVSALNEIIAIKSELGILIDENGKPFNDYSIDVENDELTLLDHRGDFFKYDPQIRETNRFQKTLFHEKETIIENCLFGVDININSVNICRLRLWIELLKNAYYKDDGELETLPNIDINIKCGNSLISRYPLDVDLKDVLRESRFSIDAYRLAVISYRNAENKYQKHEMEKLISKIKGTFTTGIDEHHPKRKKLAKLRGKINEIIKQGMFFQTESKKSLKIKIEKLTKEIKKAEDEVEELKNGIIYRNAFEWRFEFPEVLDTETGDFIGFDIIIGNPPYISAIDLKKQVCDHEYAYYKFAYKLAQGAVDLYIYFFELGFSILKSRYYLSLITPNRYLSVKYGKALREYLIDNNKLIAIGDYSEVKVFKEAMIYPIVSLFEKNKNVSAYLFKSFTFREANEDLMYRYYDSVFLGYLNDSMLGYILSDKFELTKRIIELSEPITQAGAINATSTAQEADKFHSFINQKQGFKLINTGTIDSYANTWGKTKLIDKGCCYFTPYLPKNKDILGNNRFQLYSMPKIIFAKIALRTEAFFDSKGDYASINTNCMYNFSDNYDPLFVLAWVSSKLFQYIYSCFFDGLKMSGGYLPYSSPTLSNMYIKKVSLEDQKPFINLVCRILEEKEKNPKADTSAIETKIDQMFYELYGMTKEEREIVEGKTN